MSVDAILAFERGLIIAPAGCGKTHLITNVLTIPASKPYLVLTHTTAGVAALKKRLKDLSVPRKNYVICTIDGWAKRISLTFPRSCNISETPNNPSLFYPELRQKVSIYIGSGHIIEIVQSSYSRLLVDEYQDCDVDQHKLICMLSNYLPTTVFGDPMQCIFNFGGPMPSWTEEVQKKFPIISKLDTPWRWINAGTPDLGKWILNCHHLLTQGNVIDLSSCPQHIHWHGLTGNFRTDSQCKNQAQYQIRNNYPKDSLLIIGDSSNTHSRHQFASNVQGIDVVEPVELSDITTAASRMDELNGTKLAEHTLSCLASMMTGIGKANLIQRTKTIVSGRNRTPATNTELAVIELVEQSNSRSISNLVCCLESCPQTRIYRNGAFSALKSALQLVNSDSSKTIRQAAEIIREQRRHQGDRRIPTRAIGSTLLLKGLEADHALILDAGTMNSQNLYVALSRGAKSTTVFSSSNITGN